MRDFWRGGAGRLGEFALRFTGSSDLYEADNRRPIASINFVTAHDGFTLHDLVSYNEKHNAANGEDNRDGESHNRSWNCGVEGPTEDGEVNVLRERQKRNILATLLLSQGVPMIAHGDELGRTQQGNNNVYCQDNELSWIDWTAAREHEVLTEFTARLAALRREHPVFRRQRFFQGRPIRGSSVDDIAWLRPDAQHMTEQDWTAELVPTIAIFLNGRGIPDRNEIGERIVDDSFLLLINAHHEPVTFTLPVRVLRAGLGDRAGHRRPAAGRDQPPAPVARQPAAHPGPRAARPAVPAVAVAGVGPRHTGWARSRRAGPAGRLRGWSTPGCRICRGTVTVVTGASGGIGAGVARRFAAAGAAVVLGYRHGAGRAAALGAELVENGGRAVTAAADVTDPGGCAPLMAVAHERFGRLDAVVGCAGVQPVTALPEMTAADWRAVADRQLDGAFHTVQAAAAVLTAGGRIDHAHRLGGGHPAGPRACALRVGQGGRDHVGAQCGARVRGGRDPGEHGVARLDRATGARPAVAGGCGPLA